MDCVEKRHARRVKTAAIITYACIFAAFVMLAGLHFLREDLDPSTSYLSEYGVGSHHFLFMGALSIVCLGSTTFLVALVLTSKPTAWSRLVWFSYGLWIIGVLLVAIFPTETDPLTGTGIIHNASATIAFLAFVFATWGLRVLTETDGYWKTHKNALTWLAVGNTIALILYFSVPQEIIGIFQRILVLAIALTIGTINSVFFYNSC